MVGFLALAAVPALGLSAFAAAADTGAPGSDGQQGTRPARPALTDAQKQCLADHGVTLPERPAAGTGAPPARPSADQIAAFRDAAAACGLPDVGLRGPGFGAPGFAGPGGMRPQLTDPQQQCLADQGVTFPLRPSTGDTGQRPAPPTADQRAALQQAAAACGITLPEHGPRRAFSAQGAAV